MIDAVVDVKVDCNGWGVFPLRKINNGWPKTCYLNHSTRVTVATLTELDGGLIVTFACTCRMYHRPNSFSVAANASPSSVRSRWRPEGIPGCSRVPLLPITVSVDATSHNDAHRQKNQSPDHSKSNENGVRGRDRRLAGRHASCRRAWWVAGGHVARGRGGDHNCVCAHSTVGMKRIAGVKLQDADVVWAATASMCV